jgi:RIO kinase 1
MRTPERLVPLIDQGVIEEVVRPLMSGKEAAVYLVVADGKLCVAKVYKEAEHRSFKNRADYIEGRTHKNTRSQRAMQKRSKFGREEIEAAWRSAEVDAIYRLRDAGVRVPEPYAYVDGVLVMELIAGPDGEPAPRLVDLTLTPEEAHALFHQVLREVVRMLCAGLVHGDLSDFNVLLGVDGPVVIDFPQAIDPAANLSARKLLVRDVRNLTSFLARHAPDLKSTKYGEEMWALYERNELHPDTKLTGKFKGDDRKADTRSLLDEIEEIEREARKRREALGLPPMRPARQPTLPSGPPPKPVTEGKRADDRRGGASGARFDDRRGGPGGGRADERPERRGGPAREEPGRRDGPRGQEKRNDLGPWDTRPHDHPADRREGGRGNDARRPEPRAARPPDHRDGARGQEARRPDDWTWDTRPPDRGDGPVREAGRNEPGRAAAEPRRGEGAGRVGQDRGARDSRKPQRGRGPDERAEAARDEAPVELINFNLDDVLEFGD